MKLLKEMLMLNTMTLKHNDLSFECQFVSFENELCEIQITSAVPLFLLNEGDVVSVSHLNNSIKLRIAKIDEESIYLYLPLKNKSFLNDRRQFPRFYVNFHAEIHNLSSEMDLMLKVDIVDISIEGLGFTLNKKNLLELNQVYKIIISDAELSIEADVMILDTRRFLNKMHYGSKIVSIDSNHLGSYLHYILFKQMEKIDFIFIP